MFLNIFVNDNFDMFLNDLEKIEDSENTLLSIILKSDKYINKVVKKLLKYNHISMTIHIQNIPTSIFKLNIEELMIHSCLDDTTLNNVLYGIHKLDNLKFFMIGNNSHMNVYYWNEKNNYLSSLYIYSCGLETLNSSFKNFVNLEEISLPNNKFENFPEVICELKHLKKILLNDNKLKFIPKSITNLKNLKELNINNNCFKKFPKIICNLKNLEKLYLDGNKIKKIPFEIIKLINLRTLCVSRNFINNFPPILNGLNLKLYMNDPIIIQKMNTINFKLKFLIKKGILIYSNLLKKILNYKIIKRLISIAC